MMRSRRPETTPHRRINQSSVWFITKVFTKRKDFVQMITSFEWSPPWYFCFGNLFGIFSTFYLAFDILSGSIFGILSDILSDYMIWGSRWVLAVDWTDRWCLKPLACDSARGEIHPPVASLLQGENMGMHQKTRSDEEILGYYQGKCSMFHAAPLG